MGESHIQSDFDGSFTMAYLNSFLSPYGIFPILKNTYIEGNFLILFYYGIVCCVYSLELPH